MAHRERYPAQWRSELYAVTRSGWDGLSKSEPLRVPETDLHDAWRRTPPELQDAITQAAGNIRRFCEWQKPEEWRREIQPGVCVGQVVRPLESVGCYVPGGRYPLPSTLLMTVIPAQVAGVPQIRVVSPRPAQATLAAAAFLGVREFYRVGGAQAVAALAYGTESIPRVNKIVGPGNRYVTAAKKLVAFDCAIEFLAGPTEAVFISEEGDPAFIASDLVAQAEHDPDCALRLYYEFERIGKSCADESAAAARVQIRLLPDRFLVAGPFSWLILSIRRLRPQTASRPSISRYRQRWRRSAKCWLDFS